MKWKKNQTNLLQSIPQSRILVLVERIQISSYAPAEQNRVLITRKRASLFYIHFCKLRTCKIPYLWNDGHITSQIIE